MIKIFSSTYISFLVLVLLLKYLNMYIITKICDFTKLHVTQIPSASLPPPRTFAIRGTPNLVCFCTIYKRTFGKRLRNYSTLRFWFVLNLFVVYTCSCIYLNNLGFFFSEKIIIYFSHKIITLKILNIKYFYETIHQL